MQMNVSIIFTVLFQVARVPTSVKVPPRNICLGSLHSYRCLPLQQRE